MLGGSPDRASRNGVAMSAVLLADRVITGLRDIQHGWIVIEGDVIEAVGDGNPPSPVTERIQGWLIPGFVDIHVHGGGGGSFSRGEVETVTAFHRGHGTTTMLASLVSEPVDVLVRQMHELQLHVRSGRVAGIHLEGPFLSPAHRGAHDAYVLRNPDQATLGTLLSLEGIRMVTLAPELPGCGDAIRALTSAGIVVALGHSDATSSVARQATSSGAKVVTHLFNGMRPLHHRESGLVGVGLLDERLVCELILDTHHIADDVTELALRLLGNRWMAVTDAVEAAGMSDGQFTLGGLTVEASAGVVRVVSNGSLAGSTLTMDRAFATLLYRFHVSPLEAVQGTATRPAAIVGLQHVGVLDVGRAADLVLWRDHAVVRVMKAGVWLS